MSTTIIQLIAQLSVGFDLATFPLLPLLPPVGSSACLSTQTFNAPISNSQSVCPPTPHSGGIEPDARISFAKQPHKTRISAFQQVDMRAFPYCWQSSTESLVKNMPMIVTNLRQGQINPASAPCPLNSKESDNTYSRHINSIIGLLVSPGHETARLSDSRLSPYECVPVALRRGKVVAADAVI